MFPGEFLSLSRGVHGAADISDKKDYSVLIGYVDIIIIRSLRLVKTVLAL